MATLSFVLFTLCHCPLLCFHLIANETAIEPSNKLVSDQAFPWPTLTYYLNRIDLSIKICNYKLVPISFSSRVVIDDLTCSA